MESKWRDKYESLEAYYKGEYGDTYRVLDRKTLKPKGKEEFPFYTFSQMELEIDPDETDAEIENYDPVRQREEIIKVINNFPYFCHKYVQIMHPIRGMLPFILYDYQRRVISEYDHYRFNIISKFRQGGLTTVTSIWALWRCMFRKDQTIMLMSKTDREAMTAAKMVGRAIQWLPSWLAPEMGKNNDHSKEFAHTSGSIDFQGPEAARTRALTYMILDEAAHIPGMEDHWKAMYPTLSAGGACVAISTVNGLGNWYEEIYHNAEVKKNKFHIIDLEFWEHPDYNDDDWVESTYAQLGEDGWQQEVMRSFLGSGETYIKPDIIGELDLAIREKSGPLRVKFPQWCNEHEEFMDEKGALWIWKEPVDGHEYTMAVDAADGVGKLGDNSCFEIIDDHTMEQVAEFYSNRVPPHIFAQIINQTAIYYNTAKVVVENMATSGGAVMSALQNTLMYENLYSDMTKRKVQPGIKTTSQLRPAVLEALQHRLIQRSITINSPRLIHELKTFIYNASRKRAEAQKGKHDDAIMALALAIFVRDESMKGIPVGADVPKELMDVFKSEVYEEIKKELAEGAPEDFMEEEFDIFSIYQEDVTPGVVFNVRRKFDKLLKEFDW
jgi:hypothetical protein